LQRVHDDLQEGGEVGVLRLLHHHLGFFYGEPLDFGAGGLLPIDGHDGQAIGLAELSGQADLTAQVIQAMLKHEPLEDGLGGVALVEVHALHRLDLDAGLEEGVC